MHLSSKLISVIVPTYNQQGFIGSALKSVLEQEVPEGYMLEVIVVDDDSTDDTAKIVKSFGDKVRFKKIAHSGKPARTRNEALQLAKGELIAFLDGDDLWVKNKLVSQLKVFEDPTVMLSFGTAKIIDAEGNLTGGLVVKNSELKGGEKFDSLLRQNVISTLTVIVRRDALESVGNFNESEQLFGAEDYELWLKLLAKFPSGVKSLAKPLGEYRVHPNNISSGSGLEAIERILNVYNSLSDTRLSKAQRTQLESAIQIMQENWERMNNEIRLQARSAAGKIKILHTVEFYYPSVGGAQEVVRHLSERMARAGHDVTVATTKLDDRHSAMHNGVKIIEFDVRGNTVRGIEGEKKKYQDFLRNEKFDVVMNYAAQQWTADAFFEVIDDVKAAKVFVPCGYSAFYDPEYKSYFTKLPAILKKFDATVYLSNNYRDIDFAREHNLENINVIPNGANEEEFTEPLSVERTRFLRTKYGIGGFTIMTIGLYGEKGHLDTLKVFRKLPVAKATYISAGSIRPQDGPYQQFESQAELANLSRKLANKRVVMVDGANREDVRDLLKLADVFVFLSNIECSPLVLFEAAAAGVPFLATSAGNSAEIAEWTGGGIIVKSHSADNGRVRADLKDTLWKLTKLAHSSKLRQRLGSHGREVWQKKYTWDRLTDEYLTLYKDVISRKTSK